MWLDGVLKILIVVVSPVPFGFNGVSIVLCPTCKLTPLKTLCYLNFLRKWRIYSESNLYGIIFKVLVSSSERSRTPGSHPGNRVRNASWHFARQSSLENLFSKQKLRARQRWVDSESSLYGIIFKVLVSSSERSRTPGSHPGNRVRNASWHFARQSSLENLFSKQKLRARQRWVDSESNLYGIIFKVLVSSSNG